MIPHFIEFMDCLLIGFLFFRGKVEQHLVDMLDILAGNLFKGP